MKKTASTKRALVSALLALVMTVSMLVGTTFAWFTDSVTSSGNKIVAGNLKVEMHWADGTKAIPAAGSAEWADASQGAIFDYEDWEPGYTAVRHIKIANVGNLAFRYQFNIIANGEVSKLAEVIDVYFVDGGIQVADRDQLDGIAPVGTLKDVLAGMPANVQGDLLAGQSDIVTIALEMQKNAGNEYMDLSIGSDFSVQIVATQMAAELDSFGSDYDSEAWNDVMTPPAPDANGVVEIWTAEQLAGALANTTGINTVELMDDIDLSGRMWAPPSLKGAALTINGNGHTISNMEIEGQGYLGFIGSNAKNLTINDLTFEDALIESDYSFVGVVVGYCYGNNVFNNVDVVDCVVDSEISLKAIRTGGMIGFVPVDGGTLTLKDCDVSGSEITAYHSTGAMVGSLMTSKDVTVENCSAKNNVITSGSATNLGAFAFGSGSNGYAEYVVSSGFVSENNEIKMLPTVTNTNDITAAIEAGQKTVYAQDQNFADSLGFASSAPADFVANFENCTFEGEVLGDGEMTANFTDCTFESKVSPGGSANAKFENCTFNGDSTWCFAKNATYVGCTFDSETAMHFDGLYGELVVEDCEFVSGKIQIGGGGNAKFIDCTFGETESTSIWSEKGIRVYSPTVFENCEFNNRVVVAGSNGLALTFTSCTMNGGTDVYYIDNSDGIIRGGNVPSVTIN